MSDRMIPIPFNMIMKRIVTEYRSEGTVFGVHKEYNADPGRTWSIFGEKLETPFGPAAGPNTQLAQNIVAAYFAGARFFELKTVQKLDGEDLPVAKPCILAEDEGYNVEWSTELTVPQAFDEYVKAWWACKLMAVEFGLGSPDGFIFNMSVGYDLAGIQSKKIDDFIEGLKDASATPVWEECRKTALDMIGSGLKKVTATDIASFSPAVCTSITLSTLHGCPAEDIERIASYLITEKKLNTFIKCNPTLLGYEYARKTLDDMGYDYVSFTDFHFKDDLRYELAVPMIERLLKLASDNGKTFGVKLTNTFPVDIKRNELPGNEMYMSGRALYALSLSVAQKLTHSFAGKLRISFSGGADAFNIKKLYSTGIWPITFATTILKPGGYNREVQIAGEFADISGSLKEFNGIDIRKLDELVEAAKCDPHHTKPIKAHPVRKSGKQSPLLNCQSAPCSGGCPISQDIPAYMGYVGEGRYLDALKVITLKNPLPNITGAICAHPCMGRCSRNFYEEPVHIRAMKAIAAKNAGKELEKWLADSKKNIKDRSDVKAAVIGAGPAGIASAYFLARAGASVTVYDRRELGGGTVGNVITAARIPRELIAQDIAFAKALGAEFVFGHEVKSLDELKSAGFTHVIVCVGAGRPGELKLSGITPLNAVEFLEDYNRKNGQLDLGKTVAVVGGGNTAMDTARAAATVPGVEKVYLVYRRDRRNMPADEEELTLALRDGVEFKELLSPFGYSDGKLFCRVNVLGEYDASGRRNPVTTDEIVGITADTVIAAVGEKTDTELYAALEIDVNEKGLPITDANGQTAVDCVYVAGDGLKGPATIVSAIADAARAAGDILKRTGVSLDDNPLVCEAAGLIDEAYGSVDIRKLINKKGVLCEPAADSLAAGRMPLADKCDALSADSDRRDATSADGDRCLGCDHICENCVDVCPNRANISVLVPETGSKQVIHVDRMCNECGNCTSFCPYSGSPYRDKFTLFNDIKSFNDSTNEGFMLIDRENRTFRVRLDNEITDEEPFEDFCSLPDDISSLIRTVFADYSYLFDNRM